MQILSRAVVFWGSHKATQISTFSTDSLYALGPSTDYRTLKCFLGSHYFVAWATWIIISHTGRSRHASFSMFSPMEGGFWLKFTWLYQWMHGSIDLFHNINWSSFFLCRKSDPKHIVSTPMLLSVYGVLGMRRVKKNFNLGLSDHMKPHWPHSTSPPLDHSNGLWQS